MRLWTRGRLILLAETLTYNKSALCRSPSPAFSLFYFPAKQIYFHLFWFCVDTKAILSETLELPRFMKI